MAEIHERRDRLAAILRGEGYLSVAELARRLAVSEATVRRDLCALEEANRVTRTHGGALSEYDALFVPFYQRNMRQREAKQSLAESALGAIEPGQAVFLDAGSTTYALAEALARSGPRLLTVVTNSLPAAEALASAEFEDVHLLGGRLLPHQLVLVGPGAGISLSAWHFDVAFLGAEGMTRDGLWNSRNEISEFQRHVCARTRRPVFCLDRTKLGRTAPGFLLPWSGVATLVTDAREEELLELGFDGERLPAPAQEGAEV